jgi:hypothetical protein
LTSEGTIDAIKARYNLTPANEELLKNTAV